MGGLFIKTKSFFVFITLVYKMTSDNESKPIYSTNKSHKRKNPVLFDETFDNNFEKSKISKKRRKHSNTSQNDNIKKHKTEKCSESKEIDYTRPVHPMSDRLQMKLAKEMSLKTNF